MKVLLSLLLIPSTVMCFCCGGCGLSRDTDQLRIDKEADQLRSDKSAYDGWFTTRSEQGKILPRIVEAELKAGNTDEAKRWIKRGLDDKLTVKYTVPAAQELLAVVEKEREKAAAEEARRKQEAEAEAARESAAKEKAEAEEVARQKAEEIPYEVVYSDPVRRAVALTREPASKEHVLKFAETLRRRENHMLLQIYDSRAGWNSCKKVYDDLMAASASNETFKISPLENSLAKRLDNENDKHMLVQMFKKEIRWMSPYWKPLAERVKQIEAEAKRNEAEAKERKTRERAWKKEQEEARESIAGEKAEERAGALLKYALKLYYNDMMEKGKERLQEIVNDFADTKAGKEAKQFLDALGK